MDPKDRLSQLSPGQRRRLEQRLLAAARATRRPGISRIDSDTGPLSWAQQGIWLTQRMAPDMTAFHLELSARLSGAVDADLLERALAVVIERHDALRTSFLNDESGAAFARVASRVDFHLPVTNVQEDEVADLAAAVCDLPFDLASPPLLRGRLLRLSESEHVLLLVVHHIVADGGSAAVIFRDLVSCYDRLAVGESVAVPAPAVRHLDYASWHRDEVRDAPSDGLEHWRRHLSGHRGKLEMPIDFPAPPRFSFRGARIPLTFSETEAVRLRDFGAQHGATLFMTLLTGVVVAVARFSGQTDLVIGCPVENRDRPELTEQVGLFVNTMALRAVASDHPGFVELLGRVRDTVLSGLAHRDVPFEQVFRDLGLVRDASSSPLFQVAFTYQENPAFTLTGGRFKLRIADLGTRATKNDLTFCLVGAGDGLEGYLEYNTELFHPRTVQALGTELATLLAVALDRPHLPIDELPVLTPEQYVETMRLAAGSYPTHPEGRPLHELFARSVQQFPDEIAVVAGDERLTFRELDVRASDVAARLRRAGVGPEVPVGIALDESSTRIVVAVLGVLKAGGAYVPLDLKQPSARLVSVLTIAGVDVVVTADDFADLVPAGPSHVINLDRADASAADANGSDAEPGNLAYVLFTSGSSGDPKGVAVEHRHLSAYVLAMIEQLGAPPGTSYAVVQPLTVDSPVTTLWTALVSGGTAHLIPQQQAGDPEEMRRLFEERELDCLKITPSHLAALPDVLPRRWVVVGGEPASLAMLHRVKAAGPDCAVINEYGPTETTVGGVTLEITGEEQELWGSAPIGRSIAGSQTYVLDRHLAPLPVGAVGEICVGGDCVTRGYVGRPDLTARAYVPDLFSGQPGARLYRTGDLGRYLPDGTIQCLGRIDMQLKIRGFRIEPAEIEKVLNGHCAVEFSVVDGAELTPGSASLVAYVLPQPGAALDVEALRELVRAKLPNYMVPTAFVEIDHVPRAANGKVLRSALPAPAVGDGASAGAPVSGADQVLDLMTVLWRDVLGRDNIGRGSNFFDLGGHSLLATQLVSRVRATFGTALPLSSVFENPTLAGLAEVLRMRLVDGRMGGAARIHREDLDGDLATSLAQQRMWFLCEFNRDIPIYNVPIALHVDGALDVGAVEQACTRIVERHAVLRSVFQQVNGTLVQRVLPVHPVRAEVVDFPGSEMDAVEWLRQEMSRPFDLAIGPLLRVQVGRVAEDASVLMISLHHIVFDRWSAENFHNELAQFYRAGHAGTQAQVPDLTVQYADFARWQRTHLLSEDIDRQLDYWCKLLADPPPPLTLSAQRPRPEHRRYRGDFVEFDIPSAIWEQVRTLGVRAAVTPFMVLLAAFQVVLAEAGGQRDFIIGTPIANRTTIELEPLIGFFANTLALRANLSGDPSFDELLTRVRKSAIDAYTNQDVPFDRIVEALAPRRELNRDPFFDVMFTFQNVPPSNGIELEGVGLRALPFDEWIAKRDLTLRVEEIDSAYRGVLEFDTELFDRDTIRRYADDYLRMLTRLLADPAAPVTRMRPVVNSGGSGGMGDERREAFQQIIRAQPAKVAMNTATTAAVLTLPEARNGLPVLVQAGHGDVDLAEWADDNRQPITDLLRTTGGVLFRGFHVASPQGFRRFSATQISELLDYTERSTPRHQVDENNVYTSTEYPADQYIELHNEMSYSHLWPMRISFYSRKAATHGGATPIANSREVYRRLPASLRAPFEAKGVMYLRNYGAGIDLSWRDVFQTGERAEVERYCVESGIEFEWLDGEGLRTRQVRPAVSVHPVTGESVWFNSAHMFHVAGLDPQVRKSIRELLAEDQLPRNAYYGDGSPIPDDVINEIRAVYRSVTVSFHWQDEDVLLLDNMLVCHGREPFEGTREVLVAFGEPTTSGAGKAHA